MTGQGLYGHTVVNKDDDNNLLPQGQFFSLDICIIDQTILIPEHTGADQVNVLTIVKKSWIDLPNKILRAV